MMDLLLNSLTFFLWLPLLFLNFTLLCATTSGTEKDPMHLTTLKQGILTIGTYFTNPPFEFLNNGQQVGFEVDLIKEMAHRLDLRPEFINTQWEVIIDQLMANQYDVIIGGITITPEREKLVAFSQPYVTTTLSFIINSSKTPAIHQIDDLKDQIIGVQAATTDQDIADDMQKKGKVKEVKVYPFKEFNQAISALLSGKIGVVMKVYPVADYYVQRHPELRILASVPNAPQPLGFGFNRKNSQLLQAINRVQADMLTDGTYQKIYKKWFKEDPIN